MVPQKTAKVSKPAMIVVKTVAFSLLALSIGILGMTKLASLKKPPAEAKLEERPLRVEARTVTPVTRAHWVRWPERCATR